MELCDLTATRLSPMLLHGDISAEELLQSVFRRMDEREETVHAFITIPRKKAMMQARRADRAIRRGEVPSPLTGIPVAIKDNLCTRGVLTTCGSRILGNYLAPYDATAVKRLRDAGCVIVGKTNMDEFGMGSSTENSAFGPTRNPLNPGYVAGGSSGGSAAAVACGETILAIGTDTGGSIRLPASFCGVVGIKPTYGRVSRYGVVAYASSLDQVGTLTRSVGDAALLLSVIAGQDPWDSTSAPVPVPDYRSFLGRGLNGIRIGLPNEYFVEGLDPRIREQVMAAAELLRKGGAELREISLPHTPYAISAYYLIATAEASSNLARYDGVKYGFRPDQGVADSTLMYEETRGKGFGPEVKRRIMLGTYVLSAGYYDAYYTKALKARALITEDFHRAFEKVDCIIAPVSPCPAFLLGEKIEDPLQMYLVDVYTVGLNLAGLPGLSLRCGTVEGLPVGLQIMAKPFDEGKVLQVADAYEAMTGRA